MIRRREFWICLGLAAATIAAYARVYWNDFIILDDGGYVYGNLNVVTGLSLENLLWAFTTGHEANWHPLTWLSHQADCQIFGVDPGPHHLVNVLLHGANALLLFWLFLTLTGAAWRSALVAALFALHPLHVESVAWVAERKDVLSTLFWLLTLHAYVRYVRRPAPKRYLLAILFFTLGLMSKPMLVTLPFVLLLLDIWPLGRFALGPGARARKAKGSEESAAVRWLRQAVPLLREKLPFFLLAAASSVTTYLVQKSWGAVAPASGLVAGKAANAVHSYAAYLLKTAWPAELIAYYPHPSVPYPDWKIAAASLLLIGATILAIRLAGCFPWLFFGWFWYAGTLVPVIGLIQVGSQAMADRYTYVPLIGIFVLAAWGVPELAARWSIRPATLAVVGSMLTLGFAIKTWVQVGYWKDTISLFSYALKVDSGNFMAHGLVGTALGNEEKFEEAMPYYREAVRLRPYFVDFVSNMGYALQKLGKPEEALEQYSKALRINPHHPPSLRNMGALLYEQGRYADALDYYRRSLRLMSDDVLLYLFIGNATAKLGRDQEAADAYSKVLLLQPRQAEAYLGLGILRVRQGNAREGIRNFEKALELRPGYAEAHNNLGIAFAGLGDTDQALAQYSEALRLNPEYAEAHYNKAAALYGQGRVEEAAASYEEAIRLRPDYPEAYYNLGVALADGGELKEAVAKYAEAIRLKPDYAEAYNNMGIALFNQGQVQKALDAFSEAIRLKPDYADARRNIDLIRGSLGPPSRNP